TNTLIQSIVSDEMRSRVLSVYTMSFMSMTPFGGLLAGTLAANLGPQIALLVSASICMIWSFNGLRLLPRFTRDMLKMLVSNSNSAAYRSPRLRYNP
ncbi:MAG TPA: hypothetical protein PL020_03520, partial [Candidatus Cloacimonadota bacterium]|nr:hypothetical protein [Candidatus Cloacimonadota bacterium]